MLDRRTKYIQELGQMQEAELVAVKLSPLDAVAIVNHIQITAQHTSNCKITQVACAAARKIQNAVLDSESTAYAILEAGWTEIETN